MIIDVDDEQLDEELMDIIELAISVISIID
jgi:hypothetical protein